MPSAKVYGFRNIVKALSLLVAFSLLVVQPLPVAEADEMLDWRKKVAKRIAKKHVYPRSAISREIEGKAKVRVTLARSGEILNYEVVTPTGQAVLDKAIPKMMKRLNPFPKPPDSLSDAQLTFLLPITWRIR